MLDFSKDGNTEFFGWLSAVCLLGFFVWFGFDFSPPPPRRHFQEELEKVKFKVKF